MGFFAEAGPVQIFVSNHVSWSSFEVTFWSYELKNHYWFYLWVFSDILIFFSL